MNKQERMIRLRTLKLAALILDARRSTRRTPEECALAMNITLDTYQAFESGQQSPTLPELEALAFFLRVPLEHFWGQHSLSQSESQPAADTGKRLRQVRNRAIGARLRQRRTNLNRDPDQVAEATSFTPEQINQFESGQVSIPLPQLEILAGALNLPLTELMDQYGVIGEWRSEQEMRQKFAELPAAMKQFVCKPVNRPYIELSMRLSEMSVEKLRSVAENLLEITY
jgi:transcriptional regulator with XRE-family HTH domain